MPLPEPEVGLVISYAYLWHREHERGREEASKDRPCVIVIAMKDAAGKLLLTVAPVTHSVPSDPASAVEIPRATKQRLGLDDARSLVVVSEVNDFVWPGPDLRPIPHDAGRFAYGIVPPDLFRKIRDRMIALGRRGGLRSVPRTE